VVRLLALLLLAGCAPGVGAGGGGGLLPDCDPLDDGRLTRAELALAPGIRTTLVRNDPAVDVSTLPGASDGVDRDFSEGPEDRGSTFELTEPAGAWWADRFPGATHAAPSSVDLPDLLGVYRLDDDGLWLLGLTTAQPVEASRTTAVHYDQPIEALRLPLEPGLSWGQTATWSGTVAGLPNQGVEDWSAEVGAVESARLPGGVELSEVLPVDFRLEQTFALAVGASTSTTWRRAWYAGCFGELASVGSDDPSLEPAQEYRRLLP
jgi:hypothetical protein